MKNSDIAWLAIALLSVACSKQESALPPTAPEKSPVVEELHWLTDFEAAKAQSHAEKKLLLMDFTGSDWCPPCIMLQKEVFSNPEFIHYAAQHLVLLEVDFPRRKKLSDEQRAANAKVAQQYGIEGFPTVIVLDPGSNPLGKFGYVPGLDAAKVIEVLEKARKENVDK
ncbi:MAG TPA: thioredoxin family protein [Chthoniobacterales bacterium]